MVMELLVPRFTVDMLDDFPDDGNRYELLEGFLLVSPFPSLEHQVIASRLATMLSNAVGKAAHTLAFGVIQLGDNTQLLPDILVVPSSYHADTEWRDIREWWLAVEVMSPFSRIYDREVKRAAYLALGVEEYWIVDPRTESIDIWKPGESTSTTVADVLEWRPRSLRRTVVVDLTKVFLE